MMASIQSKNTKPEMLVRRILFASGYRFRLHRHDLPGSPDIVLPGRKVAIFVNGCFWHFHEGCRFAKLPATRTEFWKTKLYCNNERDRQAVIKLNAMGWRVLWVWECATRTADVAIVLPPRLQVWMKGESAFGEIGGEDAQRN